MRAPLHQTGKANQRGAVLLVMLIIMIIGGMTYLISSLNSSTLNTAREKVTADVLAQAKSALIGYAIGDSNHPGSLPCPDIDDDGKLTMNVDYIGSNCVSPIGRLPWITLGLPELRDGAGEHLWYSVSKNFWATGTPSINSDTAGGLTITDITSGATVASNVIAIVFAPGKVLINENRSLTQTAICATTGTAVATNLCATNYLEGSNANLSTSSAPNTAYQTSVSGTSFNDQILYITHDQLLAPVEMRIAREAKKCLDDFAADATNTNHRYPWAAPVNDTTYTGTYNTFFGRISSIPNIDTAASGVPDATMSSGWSAFCAALFSSTYWTSDWRNEVFYQVADGFQPGGASFTPLTINGSGTYRATVLVGRQAIGGQIRNATDSTTYLENLNQHQTTLTDAFETYNLSAPNYSNVNDLVLCLDGRVNCL